MYLNYSEKEKKKNLPLQHYQLKQMCRIQQQQKSKLFLLAPNIDGGPYVSRLCKALGHQGDSGPALSLHYRGPVNGAGRRVIGVAFLGKISPK